MLSSDVVCLVNGHSGVDDLWLVGLLVDDWLDGLVHVVVNVLARHSWQGRGSLSRWLNDATVLELAELSSYPLRGLSFIVMSESLLDGVDKVVRVLLWKRLLVSDWLNSGVVVMLVHLSVDGLDCLLMSVWLDGLGSDGGVDYLIDIGLVATIAREVGNGVSCCFHVAI